MADRDPIQPLHQPVLPVFEEEEAWVHAQPSVSRTRRPRICSRGRSSGSTRARDQRGRRCRRHGPGRHGVAASTPTCACSRSTRDGCRPRPTTCSKRCGSATGSPSSSSTRRRRRSRDGDRSRAQPDVRGVDLRLRAASPQGRAAEAQARDARRVGRGPPPGAVAEPRRNIAKVELDRDHGGIVKLNPVADWTLDQVWDYVREHDVPYHALFDQGYTSIGCAPCTRAVAPGEAERAGRWWWEQETDKECGIHCSVGAPRVRSRIASRRTTGRREAADAVRLSRRCSSFAGRRWSSSALRPCGRGRSRDCSPGARTTSRGGAERRRSVRRLGVSMACVERRAWRADDLDGRSSPSPRPDAGERAAIAREARAPRGTRES